MTNKRMDMICSLIFLAFGGIMYTYAAKIRHLIPSDTGSGYVPKFIAICIIITAAAKLILTLLDKKKEEAQAQGSGDKVGGWGTLALMFAYVVAFEPVGFVLSTIVYLYAQITLMSDETNRNPKLFAIISIVTPIVVSLLFSRVINMPLPYGVFGF